MPQGSTERGERLARTGLFMAMAISAAVILVFGHDFSFWADELDWLTAGSDFSARTLLMPHASHLIATTRVIYEGVPRLLDADYLPFRLIGVVSFLSSVGVFFALMRRRVGGPIALLPSVVLLFFGSAQEVVASPLGIPFTLSVALGLAAWLAIERNDPRSDLLAAALLLLSILSHTFGTIIAIGAIVFFLTEPSRRRDVWVAAIPFLLWVAWWFWARQFDQSITSNSNLLGAPFFVVEAAGAAIAAAVGIGFSPIDSLSTVTRVFFDLIAVTAMALLAFRIAGADRRPWLYGYVAAAIAFWFGLGLAESAERYAATPRYLLFGAMMVYLTSGEALRGLRARRWAVPVLFALFAAALIGNAARLPAAFADIGDRTDEIKSQIGVITLAGDQIDPALSAGSLGPPASTLIAVPAGRLDDFTRDVGSLGFSPVELGEQSEEVRLGADFVLTRMLGVAAVPVPRNAKLNPVDCVVYLPGDDGYTRVEMKPGASLIELIGDTGSPGAPLNFGRFADVGSVPVATLVEGQEVVVLLGEDAALDPWFATSTGRVRVCGSGRLSSQAS